MVTLSACRLPPLQIKIIDFGAACDLATGINFNPLYGMLDPRYSPPEELVMPQGEDSRKAGGSGPERHLPSCTHLLAVGHVRSIVQ